MDRTWDSGSRDPSSTLGGRISNEVDQHVFAGPLFSISNESKAASSIRIFSNAGGRFIILDNKKEVGKPDLFISTTFRQLAFP